MTLTVEQLINALDAKSIPYIIRGVNRWHTIQFDCPFSRKHVVEFGIEGEFMPKSDAVFECRSQKNDTKISKGESYKSKLLAFLNN